MPRQIIKNQDKNTVCGWGWFSTSKKYSITGKEKDKLNGVFFLYMPRFYIESYIEPKIYIENKFEF